MAPKKAAKKAAKKADKEHGKKHHEGKDLLRAYEHLGRLAVLERLLASSVAGQIGLLIGLAEKNLLQGERKTAADLLRAGEHLGFGSLASQANASRLSEGLIPAINAEFEHLVDKAEHRWEKHSDNRPTAIADIYESMLESAHAALSKEAYRRALEFARGADALAHVHGGEMPLLEESTAGKKAQRRLRS